MCPQNNVLKEKTFERKIIGPKEYIIAGNNIAEIVGLMFSDNYSLKYVLSCARSHRIKNGNNQFNLAEILSGIFHYASIGPVNKLDLLRDLCKIYTFEQIVLANPIEPESSCKYSSIDKQALIPWKMLGDVYNIYLLATVYKKPYQLQALGASALDMRRLGVKAISLRIKGSGYGMHYLCNRVWYSVEKLSKVYSPVELKYAGISAKKMRQVGLKKSDLEGVFDEKYLTRLYVR